MTKRANVALTGGTGFVGSHVAEALVRGGHRVRALVRRPQDTGWLKGLDVEIVQGDVREEAGLNDLVRGCSTVVHVAGKTSARSEEDFLRSNAGGTKNVARATAESAPEAHFILVSSLAAAGPSRDGNVVTVDMAPGPVSAYGRSKLEGELELKRYEKLPFTILRPSAVYGPRETAIRDLFVMASRGFVPVLAGGKPRIQMVYAMDLAQAILACAARGGKGETFFVAHPEILDYAHVAKVLARLRNPPAKMIPVPAFLIKGAGVIAGVLGSLGSGPPVFSQEKAHEMLQDAWICDVTGMQAALGLMKTGFEAGALETWNWYRGAGWIKR